MGMADKLILNEDASYDLQQAVEDLESGMASLDEFIGRSKNTLSDNRNDRRLEQKVKNAEALQSQLKAIISKLKALK